MYIKNGYLTCWDSFTTGYRRQVGSWEQMTPISALYRCLWGCYVPYRRGIVFIAIVFISLWLYLYLSICVILVS